MGDLAGIVRPGRVHHVGGVACPGLARCSRCDALLAGSYAPGTYVVETLSETGYATFQVVHAGDAGYVGCDEASDLRPRQAAST